MEFSKRINDYCRIYGLTPEQVFYCMLINEGATKTEAYNIIFHPMVPAKSTSSKQLTEKTNGKGIQKFLTFLKSLRYKIEEAPEAIEEEEEEDGTKYRTKDEVLTGLVQAVRFLRGKEKADVLMKIADLQQMKKDDNTEDEERIIYYIPLRCNKCSLYLNAKSKAGSKT